MDLDAEAKHIQQFVEQGNFHAAYNIALSALNDRRKHQDQAGIDYFIQVIYGVVDALAEQFGSNKKRR